MARTKRMIKVLTPKGTPILNSEGLTWQEWFRAACYAQGHGVRPGDLAPMRRDWRAGIDPTEYGKKAVGY